MSLSHTTGRSGSQIWSQAYLLESTSSEPLNLRATQSVRTLTVCSLSGLHSIRQQVSCYSRHQGMLPRSPLQVWGMCSPSYWKHQLLLSALQRDPWWERTTLANIMPLPRQPMDNDYLQGYGRSSAPHPNLSQLCVIHWVGWGFVVSPSQLIIPLDTQFNFPHTPQVLILRPRTNKFPACKSQSQCLFSQKLEL